VAAHAACNNAKSASLAGLAHLRHWTARFQPGQSSSALECVADVTGWPRRSDRTLSTAQATYLWLLQGTRLWVRQSDYELLDPAQLRGVFMTLA
jgi:hypothetical protein